MKPDAFHQPQLPNRVTPRTILIAGASGLIGTAFTHRARAVGHTVRHLVRRPAQSADEFSWNPAGRMIDAAALDGVDTVMNLSGASISKMPWTKRYRGTLRQSRLDATTTLVDAIQAASAPPSLLLSGSGVGVYGSVPAAVTAVTEESPVGTGFLAELCAEWESAARRAEHRTTVTLLRTGLVLSAAGGMLPVVTKIAKLGGAGPLGNGRQQWPWISIDDYCSALLTLIEEPGSGPVNLTAPQSASAAEFMRTLARVVRRPYLLPAPKFALRMALGTAADELLLANQPVQPTRLSERCFEFFDVELEATLKRLLSSSSERA